MQSILFPLIFLKQLSNMRGDFLPILFIHGLEPDPGNICAVALVRYLYFGIRGDLLDLREHKPDFTKRIEPRIELLLERPMDLKVIVFMSLYFFFNHQNQARNRIDLLCSIGRNQIGKMRGSHVLQRVDVVCRWRFDEQLSRRTETDPRDE